jgi:hypothetical protein
VGRRRVGRRGRGANQRMGGGTSWNRVGSADYNSLVDGDNESQISINTANSIIQLAMENAVEGMHTQTPFETPARRTVDT